MRARPPTVTARPSHNYQLLSCAAHKTRPTNGAAAKANVGGRATGRFRRGTVFLFGAPPGRAAPARGADGAYKKRCCTAACIAGL